MPPCRLPGVTPETIIGDASRLRNPAIARVFKEIGLVEEWGTGLIGVAQELTERGLPPLEVVELPGSVRMIVRIPNHMSGGNEPHREDDVRMTAQAWSETHCYRFRHVRPRVAYMHHAPLRWLHG